MVQVIRDGKRQELSNLAELKSGDNVIISGLDVKRIAFVRQWEITQIRKSDEDPTAAATEQQVPQAHYNFAGRSFTVTGTGLASQMEALTGTIKGTIKGADRVKEVYLIANEYHPQLTDGEGNLVWEDDNQTIPALNKEVTNNTFGFSGIATAEEVAAEQDDVLAFEAKKAKIDLTNEAAIAAVMQKYMPTATVGAVANS